MHLHCYELHLRSCLAVVACLEHLLLWLLARTSTTVEAKDWLSAWVLEMADCLTVVAWWHWRRLMQLHRYAIDEESVDRCVMTDERHDLELPIQDGLRLRTESGGWLRLL